MVCSHCGRRTSTASGRCTSCGAVLDGTVLFKGSTPSGTPILTSESGGTRLPSEEFSDETRLSSAGPPSDSHPSNAPDSDETRLGVGPGTRPRTSARPSDSHLSNAPDSDETRLGGGPGTAPRAGSSAEPIAIGYPFGSRYEIIRQLGVGGMGAVYQAWDQELSVVVALKVIRPEVAGDPQSARMLERRFKQELLLARQVTHKNVVRIHDLGEINGVKYITMPYVDGEDLATILKREGTLPVPRVVQLARTLASGLAAAHAAGVVHRDLKPANIMIDADGEAMIMDFGVARSTGAVAKSGDAVPRGGMPSIAGGHTLVGMIVGTVEYMAPEQAKAQPVDHRADLYAYGLILYDLLVGRTRQTSAESALAELTSRTMAAPPSARSIDPKIPEPLDKIITRCIQPDAEARYKTTAELVADLERLDENGHLLPMVRRLTRRMVVGALTVFLAVLAATWWFARGPAVPVQHDPVSVLIADLHNSTGDATFDHALEPTLKRALEGTSFISAYDRAGINSMLGVRPPEKLDEESARALAVKQGLNVVLAGSVDRQGSGYGISLKATQTVTGNVITTVKGRAANKEDVLGAATKLVSRVLKALGDDTSDSARQFAMTTLSTTSLEVVRHHAAAMQAMSNNKFDDALRGFQKAVELDPKFGMGYQGMAAMSSNLGKRQDAEKYIGEALRHIDGMTERERYQTRGFYYYLIHDYKACLKEFGDQVKRYPASPDAHTWLATCSAYLREMPKAVAEMRRAVEILPKQVLYRANLSVFASYASDFRTAEREAQTIQNSGSFPSVLVLAFAQLGQGRISEAIETYKKLGTMGALGASIAASGLGDVAAHEGRFSDAVRILGEGAAADLAAKNNDRAAAKFALLAHTHLRRGQKGPAVAAAQKAIANSNAVKIRFLAARAFVEGGDIAKARPLIAGLAKEVLAEPQAYAKIVEGGIALQSKDLRGAAKVLIEANDLLDTWIGHFDLGRAYLEANRFTQADSEFDNCVKRRGEALALFVDAEPTYSYFPVVYYYQGRAREGMETEGFAESYRSYLNIRGKSAEDPLLSEVRRRAGTSR
jgi:tetratricopeptide (TPR) repeat protein